MRSENVPTTWKWSITFWAAYGLYECTATLSAKRKAWARNLSIARFASLTLLAGASIYVLVTKW